MKAQEMLNKVKEIIGVEASEKIKLSQATLENGTVIESEDFAIGSEVFIVTEDERVPLPVGEYTLEAGESLTIEQEGIIASIGAVESSPEIEEEVAAEETPENTPEQPKEEMGYATKEELEEVKKVVEEIKAILLPKDGEEVEEEMSDGSGNVKSEKTTSETVYAEQQELKEELSKPAANPIKHNPEKETVKKKLLYSQKRSNSTLDRVMNKISNFNNK
tara:strand:+ start:1857 stop:2513 length:657 start_codon:yes stop_codon:yes gene_type:complete